jgi:hypothetical protein
MFTATRVGFGDAFQLPDGGVFVGLIYYDVTTGTYVVPPRPGTTAVSPVTCFVVNPFSGDVFTISGFFTPVG